MAKNNMMTVVESAEFNEKLGVFVNTKVETTWYVERIVKIPLIGEIKRRVYVENPETKNAGQSAAPEHKKSFGFFARILALLFGGALIGGLLGNIGRNDVDDDDDDRDGDDYVPDDTDEVDDGDDTGDGDSE